MYEEIKAEPPILLDNKKRVLKTLPHRKTSVEIPVFRWW
jgi:hypothetical protein